MAVKDATYSGDRDPDATADAVLARLRYTLRRSVDYGSGLFVIGVIFATVTALSLRVVIPAWQGYESSYATAIRTLFHTTIVSAPTGNEQVILGVVPASIEASLGSSASKAQHPWVLQSAGLECAETKACPAGALQKAIQAGFGRADEITQDVWARCASPQSPGRESGGNLGSCIEQTLDGALSLPNGSTSLQESSTANDLAEVVRARLDPRGAAAIANPMVVPCPNFKETSQNAPNSTLPAPECDVDATFSDTTLLVPQQLVPEQVAYPLGYRTWNPRVALEIIESRLFTKVAHAIAAAFAVAARGPVTSAASSHQAGWPKPRPVAAYFISVDGLLRYWTPDGTSANPALAQANPSRDWTQSPYFYPLFTSTKSRNETDLYMDVAGHGLVRTLCYPVRGERIVGNEEGEERADYGYPYGDGAQSLPPIRPQFIGAVCVDLGFPGTEEIRELLTALQRNPLIDAAIYEITQDGAGHVTSVTRQAGGRSGAGWSDSDLIEAIRMGGCGGTYVSAQGMVPTNDVSTCVFGNNKQVDLVPLYRPASNRLVTLAIRPHAPSLPIRLKLSLLFTLLGVVGLVVCGFKLGGSQTDSKLVREMGRLRNLPVAMVECDSEDRIVAANDRLEEMVGRRVRKFGVKEPTAELKFNDLFENFFQGVNSEVGGDLEVVATDITRPGVRIKSVKLDEEIWRTRLAGRRSVYFASVRDEGVSPLKWTDDTSAKTGRKVWVKIIATPVISAGDIGTILAATEGMPVTWVPTFGVVIEATSREADILNDPQSHVKHTEVRG